MLETALTEEQRELVETTKFLAEGLLIIINDILDSSKIEAGKLELDRTAFALRETIERTVKTHRQAAFKKGLKLTCIIPAGVPKTVFGDTAKLRQVLTNLLGNAIKFTSRGEVELRVRAEISLGERALLHFSVRDTGIGIPADKQQTIFDAFSQADTSTTREFGGTGLGLTIAAKLVQLMGGKLCVESEPDKGSCFHFAVEVSVVAGEPEVLSPAETEGDTREPEEAPSLNILLAEDNPVNQKVAVRLLEKQGHRVSVAGTGKAALNLLLERSFDIVLMDLQMPEMDGFAATEAIRREQSESIRSLPIIALTAHAMAGDRERCLAAGMDGYASKPIRMEDLKREINRLWQLNRKPVAKVMT